MFNSRNLCTNFVLVFTKNRFRRFFFYYFFNIKFFLTNCFTENFFEEKKMLFWVFLWLWHFLDGFFLETNIFCLQRNHISLAQKIIRHSNFNMLNIAYHTQLCTIFVLVFGNNNFSVRKNFGSTIMVNIPSSISFLDISISCFQN